MRKTIVCLFAALLLFGFVGCSLNKEFVQQVDRNWQLIGPEYTAYVEADPALSEDSKRIRKRTAETFTALIEEARRNE